MEEKPPHSQNTDPAWRAITEESSPLPQKYHTPSLPSESPSQRMAQRLMESPPLSPPQMGKQFTPLLQPHTQFLDTGDAHRADGHIAERLRKGLMKIDARIDLHGMSQPEALAALTRFLANAIQRKHRCILIITGKGTQGEGVLRQQLPNWLNLHTINQYVQMFTPAQPKHGGDGAFYVLLKRV